MIKPRTILSQAAEGRKVQRLGESRRPQARSKRPAPYWGEDIVSSAWKHAAAIKRDGGKWLATIFEVKDQVAKMAQELKRDMETVVMGSVAEVAGDTTTARLMGTMGAWIITNDVFGSGGASGTGVGNTARTDGTQRAFTEAQVKSVLELVWTAGGDPDCIMTGGFNKQVFSGFTGNATREKAAEDKRLMAAIDIYDSDFGELQVIPNRFQRARDAWILQKDMAAIAYLRPFQLHDLAKTGDTERKQLLVEYTLEMRNEAAHGLVADLTTA